MKHTETVDQKPILLEPPAAAPPESDWAISIRDKLEQALQEESARPWAEHSIYRVPKPIRELDEEAYVPEMVSIGPYHHGRHRGMEIHKWRALHHVLRRTGHGIALYLESIKSLEVKARSCYEGNVSLTNDEFVEMMVLDGTFVLELFRGAAGRWRPPEELGYSRDDPVFSMRGTMRLRPDLIMLENQIPFFVLDRLHFLQTGDPERSGRVATLSAQFFDPLMPTDEPRGGGEGDRGRLPADGLHCLDVLINSDEDVGCLAYHGIIEHWQGDDGEVADLFNRLCRKVVFDVDDSYLSGVSEMVNSYYSQRWNTWRASLKRNYCGNPWAIISLIAAVVLLLLTFSQTFYAVYAYYRPAS